MIGIDSAVLRLPIVLVVDPVPTSRFTLWRLLSRAVGVLEAPDAAHAHHWLRSRRVIDALIVQEKLPDAEGGELLRSLVAARVAAASRGILVTRPVDYRSVVATLTDWFFARDPARAAALRRDAERLVS